MKRIIAIFVIMLAFSVSANAQQKAATTKTTNKVETKGAEKKSPKDIKEASMNDLVALKKVIAFEGTQEADLLRLFEHKYSLLQEDLSTERKQVLSESIEAKLKATLTPAQMEKLAAKPALLKQLCN